MKIFGDYWIISEKVKPLLSKTSYDKGHYQLSVESGNLPVGMYYLVLRTSNEMVSKKVMILGNR